jgi:putative endonuclease
VNLGAAGEKAAARFLKGLGYRLVRRNYRSKVGEIDIIALDGDTLVFVEVKTLRSDDASWPEEHVNAAKRRKLIQAAKYYLSSKSAMDRPCRFDVIAVTMPVDGSPQIEHFIDAFSPLHR